MRLRRNAITHAIEDEGQYFMVDWGGGSTILHQLKHAGYDWMDMRHIFVTHKHVDHLDGTDDLPVYEPRGL